MPGYQSCRQMPPCSRTKAVPRAQILEYMLRKKNRNCSMQFGIGSGHSACLDGDELKHEGKEGEEKKSEGRSQPHIYAERFQEEEAIGGRGERGDHYGKP